MIAKELVWTFDPCPPDAVGTPSEWDAWVAMLGDAQYQIRIGDTFTVFDEMHEIAWSPFAALGEAMDAAQRHADERVAKMLSDWALDTMHSCLCAVETLNTDCGLGDDPLVKSQRAAIETIDRILSNRKGGAG